MAHTIKVGPSSALFGPIMVKQAYGCSVFAHTPDEFKPKKARAVIKKYMKMAINDLNHSDAETLFKFGGVQKIKLKNKLAKPDCVIPFTPPSIPIAKPKIKLPVKLAEPDQIMIPFTPKSIIPIPKPSWMQACADAKEALHAARRSFEVANQACHDAHNQLGRIQAQLVARGDGTWYLPLRLHQDFKDARQILEAREDQRDAARQSLNDAVKNNINVWRYPQWM